MIDQATLKSVEDLHRLKTEGVITSEEFDRAKEKLLFGSKPTATNPVFAAATGASNPPPTPDFEDLKGWVTLPLKRYADFTGRSSRREFWLFQGAVVVAVIVAFVLIGGDLTATGGTVFSALMLFIVGTAMLALVVPLLAVQVRRLHDQDKSGWFVLLNFVPYVGALIVLVLMLLEGTKGENRYGPDPWK